MRNLDNNKNQLLKLKQKEKMGIFAANHIDLLLLIIKRLEECNDTEKLFAFLLEEDTQEFFRLLKLDENNFSVEEKRFGIDVPISHEIKEFVTEKISFLLKDLATEFSILAIQEEETIKHIYALNIYKKTHTPFVDIKALFAFYQHELQEYYKLSLKNVTLFLLSKARDKLRSMGIEQEELQIYDDTHKFLYCALKEIIEQRYKFGIDQSFRKTIELAQMYFSNTRQQLNAFFGNIFDLLIQYLIQNKNILKDKISSLYAKAQEEYNKHGAAVSTPEEIKREYKEILDELSKYIANLDLVDASSEVEAMLAIRLVLESAIKLQNFLLKYNEDINHCEKSIVSLEQLVAANDEIKAKGCADSIVARALREIIYYLKSELDKGKTPILLGTTSDMRQIIERYAFNHREFDNAFNLSFEDPKNKQPYKFLVINWFIQNKISLIQKLKNELETCCNRISIFRKRCDEECSIPSLHKKFTQLINKAENLSMEADEYIKVTEKNAHDDDVFLDSYLSAALAVKNLQNQSYTISNRFDELQKKLDHEALKNINAYCTQESSALSLSLIVNAILDNKIADSKEITMLLQHYQDMTPELFERTYPFVRETTGQSVALLIIDYLMDNKKLLVEGLISKLSEYAKVIENFFASDEQKSYLARVNNIRQDIQKCSIDLPNREFIAQYCQLQILLDTCKENCSKLEKDLEHLIKRFNSADPYVVLGVVPNATLTQINEAHRKLSLQYHPDKHATNPELSKQANEIIKLINVANDRIKHARDRQQNNPFAGGNFWFSGASSSSSSSKPNINPGYKN